MNNCKCEEVKSLKRELESRNHVEEMNINEMVELKIKLESVEHELEVTKSYIKNPDDLIDWVDHIRKEKEENIKSFYKLRSEKEKIKKDAINDFKEKTKALLVNNRGDR